MTVDRIYTTDNDARSTIHRKKEIIHFFLYYCLPNIYIYVYLYVVEEQQQYSILVLKAEK